MTSSLLGDLRNETNDDYLESVHVNDQAPRNSLRALNNSI